MALIDCSECGSQISDRASACPKCGNPLHEAVAAPRASVKRKEVPATGSSRVTRWIARAGAIAVAGLVLLYLDRPVPKSEATQSAETSSDSQQAPREQPVADARAAPPVSIIDVSAAQLYADYAANEVSADSKYKGKWLYVTGNVAEIGKDFTDDPYVSLVGESRYANVRALFKKSMNGQLAELQKGQKISLTCVGKGRLVGDAILDCRQDHVPKHQPTEQ